MLARPRQSECGAQAAEFAAAERDVAAVAARDVAGDGQAEAYPFLIARAGFIEPRERAKRFFV